MMSSFKEKIFDGPYEVVEIQITNEGKNFRGIIYFPDKNKFKKPFPVIIYFQGFPQILPFFHIIQELKYLLNLGFAIILVYLRGYKFSEGTISIQGQISDGLKIIDFLELMAKKSVIDNKYINILARDFGAFISLAISSKIDKINYLGILNPILDVSKHIESKKFHETLNYINKFLPGMIHGIENVDKFIKNTIIELRDYPIQKIISHLNAKKIMVILGEKDKITPLEEFYRIFNNCNVSFIEVIIDKMEHEPAFEIEKNLIEQEFSTFFKELI